MFRRSRIVWKLSAVFTIILLAFIFAQNAIIRVSDRNALASARDLCKINSATIKHSIKKLLVTRDNECIREMLDSLAKDEALYSEVRLVPHRGKTASAGDGSSPEPSPEGSPSCQACHRYDNPLDGLAEPNHDELVELPDGTRLVSVAEDDDVGADL